MLSYDPEIVVIPSQVLAAVIVIFIITIIINFMLLLVFQFYSYTQILFLNIRPNDREIDGDISPDNTGKRC